MDNEQIALLAQKAAVGDTDAFNELYRLTRDRAYFVALSITKNEDDAMDMLQEAYLKAWQKRGSLKQPERFVSWFNQIVANTARDFLRARKPLLFAETEGGEAGLLDWQPELEAGYIPHAAMDTAETRRLILEIVDALPEDLRLVTLLHYYDDMPLADIAASLELPMSTVKARLRYARAKISRGVEDLEKRGTKLYGAAPIPLALWFLKHAAAESTTKFPPVILGGAAAGSVVAGATIAGIAVPKLVAGVAAAVILAGAVTTSTVLARHAKQPIEPAGIAETGEYANAAENLLFPLPAWPEAAPPEAAGEPQLNMAEMGAVVPTATTSPVKPPVDDAVSPPKTPQQPDKPQPVTDPPTIITLVHDVLVTYDYAQNGGTSATTSKVMSQQGAAADLSPKAVKAGWEFVGWNTDKNARTGLSSYTINGNTTFYAIFSKQVSDVLVTYNYAQNGGNSATKTSASVQSNSAADLTPMAAKSGWEFLGWNTDRNARAGMTSCIANGSTTLYAIFRKQVTATFVTVKYVNLGYYSEGSNELRSETVSAWRYNNENAAIVSPGLETRVIKYYNSTTFAPIGWGLAGDGADGRARFAPRATVSLAENETFYGIYAGGTESIFFVNAENTDVHYTVPTTIVYNMSKSASTAYAKVYRLPITIPPAPPAKPGFTFTGWSENSDGGSGCHRPGQTVIPSGATTYYAVWTPV